MSKASVICIFIALSVSFIGCSKKEHPLLETGNFIRLNSQQVIDIDAEKPAILPFVSLQQAIDSMYFVQLSDEVLIGNIDKIIITDDRIYILDAFSTEQVFIHDHIGNLVNLISAKGRAPNEYSAISDMAIDDEAGEIVLNDPRSACKLVYTLDGAFVRKERSILPSFFFECINGTYIDNLGYMQSFSETVNYQLVTSRKDDVRRKAFPYYPIQENDFLSKGLSRNYLNEILFAPSYCDTVYCITTDSTYYAKYHIKQKRSIWQKAYKRVSFSEAVDLIKKEGYTELEGQVWENENYILFDIGKATRDNRILQSPHLYDKNKNIVYEYANRMNSGDVQSASGSTMIFDYKTLSSTISVRHDFFVSQFNPFLLKAAFEKALSEGYDPIIIDPVLQTIIDSASNGSNPALVFYRVKNIEL